MPTVRLLPYDIADGAWNMAADETLLQSAIEGEASLRIYAWSTATVSLGYFQPAAARLPNLPWVRRPTGGNLLAHHHELTYALALPAFLAEHKADPWLPRMHRLIARALEKLGVAVQLVEDCACADDPTLCFRQRTPGDLTCAGHKIVGSAQRRQRQCLLQHGAILLAQSEYTPSLPGIRELTGRELTVEETALALMDAFEADTGWRLGPTYWSPREQERIAELAADKYSSPAWNDKR